VSGWGGEHCIAPLTPLPLHMSSLSPANPPLTLSPFSLFSLQPPNNLKHVQQLRATLPQHKKTISKGRYNNTECGQDGLFIVDEDRQAAENV